MQTAAELIARAATRQKDVAERLRVSAQRLSEWKHGHRPIPDDKIVALAELAGVDPREALGRYHWERHLKKGGAHLAKAASLLLGCAVGALTAAPQMAEASTGNRLTWSVASDYHTTESDREGSSLLATNYPQCLTNIKRAARRALELLRLW